MRIRAVIFDWAGTTVDYGCRAPVQVLVRIFAASGVELLPAESRHAMGLMKKDQIREILRLPRVAEAWRASRGAPPEEEDVRLLFDRFIPDQLACIEEYSDVIPGVPTVAARLRERGIRIGSTTGYTREMLQLVLARARGQNYAPDVSITPTETGEGRPAPWMIFENMRRLNVYPPDACIKVGDTPSDIQEGRNAGVWTVGVAASSSDACLLGIDAARSRLRSSGADFVVDTLAELDAVIEDLNARAESTMRTV